ncbi:hypothetical protein PIB30_085368 [Stylosanthes scabra]|uniref:SET domain-containing protein n=1 Tax=Stylosanthes scabra TaxID=79078 RepID=A0ABU6YRL4_9FABA|nr:hypothetical protein [Stylosanthes scabra]
MPVWAAIWDLQLPSCMRGVWVKNLLGQGTFRSCPNKSVCHWFGPSMKSMSFCVEPNFIRQTVKEDKVLICEDWKENIFPLLDSAPSRLNPTFFGIEQYFAAKSLISSRGFEIDDYHGFGMVPLADLFNHKTGAEDVHFTASSNYVSDDDADDNNINNDESIADEETLAEKLSTDTTDVDAPQVENGNASDTECLSDMGDGDPSLLEMIVVKDVSSGEEVFNTYGLMGNAALLHRYGFTEQDNPYDIVNIDLEMVLQWCSSLFTDRHSRSRVSIWRRLGYSGCGDKNSEYFEISFEGEPQTELIVLLYVMLLPDNAYHKLDLSLSVAGSGHESSDANLLDDNIFAIKSCNVSKKSLLTKKVCDGFLALVNMRECLYGSESIEDDIVRLGNCSSVRERKLYHSLVLQICERRILQRLRDFASEPFETNNHGSSRKKLKKSTKRKR